jgi:hypothetical protein
MLSLIIAILLNLGIIFSPAEYNNASEQEKQEMRQKGNIIEDQVVGF